MTRRRIFDMGRGMPSWDGHVEVTGPGDAVTLERVRAAAQYAIADALHRIAVEFREWTGVDTTFFAQDPIVISNDTYTHLVELARDGDETIFKEYAAMVGVPAEKLDELWLGTRKRITA